MKISWTRIFFFFFKLLRILQVKHWIANRILERKNISNIVNTFFRVAAKPLGYSKSKLLVIRCYRSKKFLKGTRRVKLPVKPDMWLSGQHPKELRNAHPCVHAMTPPKTADHRR